MDIDFTNTKYTKPASSGVKRRKDPFKILIILIFVVILGWGGYLFAQKEILSKENKRFETSIESLNKQVKTLLNSENPAKKIAVSKTLNKISSKRILWSKKMAEVLKLEIPGVSFRDFSVTKEGEVTAILSTKNFNSIQNFVNKLNTNDGIDDVVINSIRQKEIAEGGGLSIDINFKFKK